MRQIANKRLCQIAFVSFLLFAFFTLSHAGQPASSNYKLVRDMFSSDNGYQTQSETYTIKAVSGQTPESGLISSENYKEFVGFVRPIQDDPVETITKPGVPEGNTRPIIGETYTYSTTGATSSLEEPVEYRFNWGNGAYSVWSDATTADRTWNSNNVTNVTVEARSTVSPEITNNSDPLTVNPEYQKYTVSIACNGNGMIKVDNILYSTEYVDSHVINSEVQIEAVPNSDDYTFSSWSGISSSNNPATIVVTDNMVITASFVEVQQIVQLSLGAVGDGHIKVNGELYNTPAQIQLNENDSVSLDAQPSNLWKFSYWQGLGTDNPLNITMDSDKSFTAVFNEIPVYSVVVNSNIEDTQVRINGGSPVALPHSYTDIDGSTHEIVALPSDRFKEWTGDLTGSLATKTFTLEDNMNITANFKTLGWKLYLEGQNIGENILYQREVSFGIESQAYSASSLPNPPKYTCSMVLLQIPYWSNPLKEYYQEEGKTEYVWVIVINPVGNTLAEGSSVLSWDSSTFNEGYYQLRQGFDGQGTILIKDMKSVSSYTITGGSGSQYFSIVWTEDPPSLWETVFTATSVIVNTQIQYESEVTIGVADTVRISQAPPDSPTFSTSMKIIPVPNWLNSYSEYILADGESMYTWVIAVNPHGPVGAPDEDATAILSWNPDNLYSEGYYQLKRGYKGNGETIISDMRAVTQCEIVGINAFQYYTIVWTSLYSMEFDLNEGWNLISFPLTPTGNFTRETIFPESSDAYSFSDGRYNKLNSQENFQTGKGYWLYTTVSKKYTVFGVPLFEYSVDLTPGWHLVGATCSEQAPQTDVSNGINIIYEYMSGRYSPKTVLYPTIGYWVYINENSMFSVSE
ncbi:conserved hypothetical protein, secreted [Candidatus Magnetomorum sp. HK-1]|nr:conserved hypothetical protein, secreted [Candidatus Magnetomorum sp. HK-1]